MSSKRKQTSKKIQASLKKSKKSKLEDKGKQTLVDEVDDDAQSEATMSEAKSTCSTRTTRGRTHMHCLAMQRVLGIVKDVEFNHDGNPIGENAIKMQSYIGVLAREKVKITYDTWHDVPADVKDLIWDSVKLCFNVDENWKRGCIRSANDKWRQFKAMLTNDYVYERADSPDMRHPPEEYPFIEKKDWTDFCLTRLTDNFKKQTEKQKARRALAAYPYRLSRKGHANHVEQNPDLLSDDREVTQATLWVEGRKSKDGLHERDDDLMEKIAKIDEIIKQKKAGTLKKKEMKGTILESALEKKELNGRLRGIGGYTTRSTYYGVPRGNSIYSKLCSQQRQELLDERKKNSEQDERIAKLESIVYKHFAKEDMADEKGSCSVQFKPDVQLDEAETSSDDRVKLEEDNMEIPYPDVELVDKNVFFIGKPVALILESNTNIVAFGTVVKVHGLNEKFPKDCMQVSIDEAVDENAPLPFPTKECQVLGDAVGSHVTWPTRLLNLKKKPKGDEKEVRPDSNLDFSTIPKALRVVYCYCKATLQSMGNITIKLDEATFGHERSLYIHIEEVEPFCRLMPISYMCIAAYTWHLFKKLTSLCKIDKFRFVDPARVSHISSLASDKKSIREGTERRAQELATRLVGTLPNQVVLVPCNVGAHWILTVIDPHKEEVGLLDPLYNRIHDGVWKQIVDMAMKMFNAEKQRKGKKTPTWSMIKVPKQPDGSQRGYYVLKYMKEIVESDAFETIGSLQSLVIVIIEVKIDFIW